MGAKDSKLSCISYEEAIKRGKVFLLDFHCTSVGLSSLQVKKKRNKKTKTSTEPA